MLVKELIELITDGYDFDNIETIIKNCEEAQNAPATYAAENDLLWLLDINPNSIVNFVIPNELEEILIFGDKIDEIHEMLSEFQEELPEFPYDENLLPSEYYEWVDGLLKENDEEMIQIGDTYTDVINLVVVNRANTDRIIEIAQAIGLKCIRPN